MNIFQKEEKFDFSVGNEAREKLVDCLDRVAEAVGSTMGPGGRPFGFDKVGIDMLLTPTFSKDGLTVLRALRSNDLVQKAVLGYCKQASGMSVMESGDGTTSTIVLASKVANAIISSNIKYPQAFARQIEKESKMAVDAIKAEAIKDEKAIKIVAMTSSNGDEELTDVVINAVKESSAFGSILTVKNPASPDRYLISKQDGYSNCRGYEWNNTFAVSVSENAAAGKSIEWSNPYVMCFNGALMLKTQLDPMINAWVSLCAKDARSLAIVVHDDRVSEEIVNNLMVLNRKLADKGVAVFIVQTKLTAERNSSLHIMRDIAAFTGIQDEKIIDGGNYSKVDESFIGSCKGIKINPVSTIFLGRSDDHWVEKRIDQNHSLAESALSEFDREITKIRNAELAEGLVKVEIGGGLMPDLQEREDRFDDASKAAQACMRNGALPGGGSSYIRASNLIDCSPEFKSALRAIYDNVLTNYGTDPDANFNPEKGESYKISEDGKILHGNALELGVLDACDTVCSVIKNGVALGVKLATIGGYIYREQQD